MTLTVFNELLRVLVLIGLALVLLMFAGLLIAGVMSFLGFENPW